MNWRDGKDEPLSTVVLDLCISTLVIVGTVCGIVWLLRITLR